MRIRKREGVAGALAFALTCFCLLCIIFFTASVHASVGVGYHAVQAPLVVTPTDTSTPSPTVTTTPSPTVTTQRDQERFSIANGQHDRGRENIANRRGFAWRVTNQQRNIHQHQPGCERSVYPGEQPGQSIESGRQPSRQCFASYPDGPGWGRVARPAINSGAHNLTQTAGSHSIAKVTPQWCGPLETHTRRRPTGSVIYSTGQWCV